ncbi:MAG: efflux RND transporter periplasmic adaptor subunit [Acidobacteriota bacterium]
MSPEFSNPLATLSSPSGARRMAFVGLIFVALCLPLACGGAGSQNSSESTEAGPSAAEQDAARQLEVRTRVLEPRPVVDRASLPADLLPRRRATLAAEVPGVVERLTVELGDAVGRGQVLASVDSRALQQAVVEAEAVAARNLKRFERANNLFERRSITEQQLLDAVTDRDVGQARLDSVRLELNKSRLRAPWPGRVAERLVEVGDYVTPGQPMVAILDASVLKARAPVPASDVSYLEEGTPVTLLVEGGLGSFEGSITRLGAELDRDARTLVAEAEIPNADGRLKPGMIALMSVQRRVLPEALLVPQEALIDLGGRQAVFIVVEEQGELRARRRELTLGPTVDGETVVLEGLEPGQRVVVRGQDALGEGQAVREAPVSGEGNGEGGLP